MMHCLAYSIYQVLNLVVSSVGVINVYLRIKLYDSKCTVIDRPLGQMACVITGRKHKKRKTRAKGNMYMIIYKYVRKMGKGWNI